MIDVNSNKYSNLRFCKNCNNIILSENRKAEYCSDKCRSIYGTRKWRDKKKKKQGDMNE